MSEFGLLSAALVLVALAAFIWLVIVAFRESLVWGLLVLLVLPFGVLPLAAIAFALYHWDVAKKPFLAFILAYISFVAISLNAFNQIGGWEVFETAQQATTQLENDEISEAEAARRVAEQMESSIRRMEEAGLIASEKGQVLQEKVQRLKLEEEGAAAGGTPGTTSSPSTITTTDEPSTTVSTTTAGDAAGSPETPATEVPAIEPPATEATGVVQEGPGWSLDEVEARRHEILRQQQLDLPAPRLEGDYVPIPVSRAEDYLGRQVRVVTAAASHEGLLVSADANHLVLDMPAAGGQVRFDIKRPQVQSLYYRLPAPAE
ncbi:MAG: hypothetical protein R6X06_00780 [Gammaproteobacteria bacterium]